MKLKIIGTGSDGNCYILEDCKKSSIMLECGIRPEKVKKEMNYDFSRVEGCFISHEHLDHCEYHKEIEKLGVKVYTNQTELMTWNSSYMDSDAVTKTKNFIVQPFDVEHDANKPLGFLIESIIDRCNILFIIDTAYVRWKFKDIDFLIIEFNYDDETLNENRANYPNELIERIKENHMGLEKLVQFFKQQNLNTLQHVILIHASKNNLNEKKAIQEIENIVPCCKVTMAKNLMEIIL